MQVSKNIWPKPVQCMVVVVLVVLVVLVVEVVEVFRNKKF
jgi:hypothetical protein